MIGSLFKIILNELSNKENLKNSAISFLIYSILFLIPSFMSSKYIMVPLSKSFLRPSKNFVSMFSN